MNTPTTDKPTDINHVETCLARALAVLALRKMSASVRIDVALRWLKEAQGKGTPTPRSKASVEKPYTSGLPSRSTSP